MKMKSIIFISALLTWSSAHVIQDSQSEEICPLYRSNDVNDNDTDRFAPFSFNLDALDLKADIAKYKKAAIVSDSPPCAKVGLAILNKRGTIGDAAIAVLNCMGATHPHTSGMGGGFVCMHYDFKNKKSTVYNAREKAPLRATEGMFDNAEPEATKVGGLAIAIPGEIRGYQEIYKRIGGKVAWKDLFEPTIKMLTNGYKVSPHMAQALLNEGANERIMKEQNLKDIYVNKATGEVWKLNDIIKDLIQAETMKIIAAKPDDFYTGNLMKEMMKELKARNSIITEDDFRSYKVTIVDAMKSKVESLTMHSPGAPASGSLLTFLFRLLSTFKNNFKQDDSASIHLYAESLKHTYGRRRNLGDPEDSKNRNNILAFEKKISEDDAYLKSVLAKIDPTKTNPNIKNYQDDTFSKMDEGTAHMVINGPDGDAISCTTTINTYFGSSVRSKETGVIFNDQMADFVSDPKERKSSPANAIKGGKRPSTSASPVIFTNSKGEVKLNMGGAGGVRILSAVSMVTMRHLWFGRNIGDAIEGRRYHHILDPENIELEFEKSNSSSTDKALKKGLEGYRHKVKSWTQRTVVVGISRSDDGSLQAAFDSRKEGSVEGF